MAVVVVNNNNDDSDDDDDNLQSFLSRGTDVANKLGNVLLCF